MYSTLDWNDKYSYLVANSKPSVPYPRILKHISKLSAANWCQDNFKRKKNTPEAKRQRENHQMLCLLYTPSPAYLRRPWWFCWIKGLARGQRCFHGNCRDPTGAGFRKRCQIDCQQFIRRLVEQQLQETAANNCIQTYSNHLIRNHSFPKCFSRKIFKSFPKKKFFFQITPNLKSYWIFQTKIRCTTPLYLGINHAPRTFPTPLECCPRQIRLEESPRDFAVPIWFSADWNTKVWDKLRCAWCRSYTGEHDYRLPFELKQK